MSIEKTTSIILSTTPYRESSLLVTLYSHHHGRINTIAKGIRRRDRQSTPLERGSIIEHTLYMSPHRDLHQITNCSIVDFFSNIRCDLEKTALRDLLFDILLSSLSASDCNEPLFTTLHTFLTHIDNARIQNTGAILYTSRTLFALAENLGFSADFTSCATCGKTFSDHANSFFSVKEGTLQCSHCCTSHSESHLPISSIFLNELSTPFDKNPPISTSLLATEAISLLRLSIYFCRYHFDIRKNLPSLIFIEQLFSTYTNSNQCVKPVTTKPDQIKSPTIKENTCQILP